MNGKIVTIAGGSGLIGRALAEKLANKNYVVKILTRNPEKIADYEAVYWNPSKNEIDAKKILDSDFIINLAGENIADKRWTKSQKEKILKSRTDATKLLYNTFSSDKNKVRAYVGASAVGFYGAKTVNKIFTESDKSGNDFLAEVCTLWENDARSFEKLNIRTVILRIGVAFSKKGGAFPKLALPLKFGVINSIGTGRQILPWIHIDDLTEMFQFAIENENLNGVFNAVAPKPISYNELVREMVKIKKAVRLPNVPAFLIKAALGEMSAILLEGSAVSSKKIVDAGFRFKYETIDKALKNLFSKRN